MQLGEGTSAKEQNETLKPPLLASRTGISTDSTRS